MNMHDPRQLAVLLEAILLAAGRPLTLAALAELFEPFERPEPHQLAEALEVLQELCLGRGIELVEVASGYRLQVRSRFAPWVSRLWEERAPRYSRALLETLALIAYRQPVTRGEIEEVRGVAVNSNIIRTLAEREWIRVVGHREVPGRPALFATTRRFLDDFNLKNLDELPPLSVLRELAPEPESEEPPAVPSALANHAPDSAEDDLGFGALLAELDEMEQGLKNDFNDLPPLTLELTPEAEGQL